MMKQEVAERLDLLRDPRRLRALWLRHLSETVEAQLRSPPFLHWLWYGLTTMAAVQTFQSHSLGLLSTRARPSARPPSAVREASSKPDAAR